MRVRGPSALIGLAFVLASIACLRLVEGVGEKPELVARVPVTDVGDVVSGTTLHLSIPLVNRSGHPVRIVGSEDGCMPEGCIASEGLPLAIPPSAEATLGVKFTASTPGRLRSELILYTDAKGQPTLTLTFTGRVVAGSDFPPGH